MKKIFTLLIGIVFSFTILNAQDAPPQAFSFKALIKDRTGSPVVNRTITLRISILQGAANGIVVYSERFRPTTNLYAQIDVEIGRGTVISGIFSAIDWSAGAYFLKVEVDPKGGMNFYVMSVSQLLSVPYALYSGAAANSFSGYYSDLIGAPVLSFVATSGNYFDLLGRPTLFSGDYNDLINKPILFSGNYDDLLNKPTLFDGTWSSLSGKPVLAPIALSGNWNDLMNNPFLISSPLANQMLRFNSVSGKWENWIPDFLITEVDGSVTNEIQTLTISGNTIFLSDGGTVTLPAMTGQYYFVDRDNDNYGDQYYPVWTPSGVEPPAHFVIDNTDCNDNSAVVHPDLVEIDDDIDNDCDGLIDEGIPVCTPGSTEYRSCGGGVGVCLGGTQTRICGPEGFWSDWSICEGEILPSPEICDGIDNDCDGQIDEGCTTTCSSNSNCPVGFHCDNTVCVPNLSNGSPCTVNGQCMSGICINGFCVSSTSEDKDQDGYPVTTDCNDNDAAINPGATEVCGDGIDQNCNSIDFFTLNPDELTLYGGDNKYISVLTEVSAGSGGIPITVTVTNTDITITSRTNIAEGTDFGYFVVNVNGGAESALADLFVTLNIDGTYCTKSIKVTIINVLLKDTDADGYPDWIDCNDTDPTIHPDALDVCDGIDQNCKDGEGDCLRDVDGDGIHDLQDNCPGNSNPGQEDIDEDGVGDVCDDQDSDGYALGGGDCNDTNASINPGATEICDGLDNDCDGEIDEGCTTTCSSNSNCPVGFHCDNTVCVPNLSNGSPCTVNGQCMSGICINGFCVSSTSEDKDQDGYPVTTDCNDNDPTIHPGTPEICDDGIDQDCNGSDLMCPIDTDNDGLPDGSDNCPNEANPDQLDSDNDGIGDICDLTYNYYDWEYDVYPIGDQIWMTQDLKATKLNDGTEIPEVSDILGWSSLTSPGYCHRYSNEYDCSVLFYNWHTVNTGKLCPIGWHVPTADDWQTLSTYVEEYVSHGIGSLRSNENVILTWFCPNGDPCFNESQFGAMPNGFRRDDGTFSWGFGTVSYWSTTPSKWDPINNMTTFDITCSDALLGDAPKSYGVNVRCIKD